MKGQEQTAPKPNGAKSRGGGKITLCFDEVETKLLFRLVRYAVGQSLVDLDLVEQNQGEVLIERMREFLWSLARVRDEERAKGASSSGPGRASTAEQ